MEPLSLEEQTTHHRARLGVFSVSSSKCGEEERRTRLERKRAEGDKGV